MQITLQPMRYLVSAALIAASIAVISPAQANGGNIVAQNGVILDGCFRHDFGFDFDIPEYADHWSADIRALGPDGREEASAFIFGEGRAAGDDDIQICDPGTYSLEATVEWSDYDGDSEGSFEVSGNTFTIRAPRTRTGLVGKVGSKQHRLVATVKDERPNGYFPTDFIEVLLQTKRGGRWVTVDKDFTNDRGKAVMSARNKPGRQAFRVKTRPQSYVDVAGSVSRIVRL